MAEEKQHPPEGIPAPPPVQHPQNVPPPLHPQQIHPGSQNPSQMVTPEHGQYIGQPQQQPVYIQMARPAPRTYENYKSQLSKRLGIIQIVCGGLSIVLNAIGMAVNIHHTNLYDYSYGGGSGNYDWSDTIAYYVASGIWCTIFFVLSGSFAICAGFKRTRCTIITHLVLAIFGSIFAFIHLCLSGWALGHDSYRLSKGFRYYVNDYHRSYPTSYNPQQIPKYAYEKVTPSKGMVAVSLFYFVVALVEFVVCVWSSTLCCRVTSCCETTQTPAVQYYAGASHPNQLQTAVMIQQVPGTQMVPAEYVNHAMVQPYTVMQPQGGMIVQNPTTVSGAMAPPPYQQG